MIKKTIYVFKNFEIQEQNNTLILKATNEEYDVEQMKVFTMMLNFGYIGFESGDFKVTAKDIISFWEYSKSSILKNYSLEQYYSIFGLGKLYTEKLPSIKTEGAFHANDFKMTVVWQKTNSNMYSAPLAYKQEGLKLKELQYGDVLGALYPEHFNLYYLIDEANSNWKKWNLKERYDFLEKLERYSKLRNIIIPGNLMELLNKHRDEKEE